MLIAKPFIGIVQNNTAFGNEYPVTSTNTDSFTSNILPSDSIKISFNPNGKSTGSYVFKSDKRKYSDYQLPTLQQQPLSLLGMFILNGTNVKLGANYLDRQVDIVYEKKTMERNFDPYSYRFFSVDDENQEFKLLNCEDVPSQDEWKYSIDLSKQQNRQVKFAVFGFNNIIGEMNREYSIHYNRMLKFALSDLNSGLEISFSSELFPQINNGVKFILKEKQDATQFNNFMNVMRFTIVQTVRSDILSERKFQYNNKLSDMEGNKISNLTRLQCVYITNSGIIYGTSLVTIESNNQYTLHVMK
ncbi:predicted protein [Naegleria gruberi]|uniref:Predicted protein n=1 Tax=Naegleria gruberi TaxID=5762 RepID=D2VT42_NAEGR|nr:uncharacterized protein NAEGRDRAFT_72166 [Naegleria gruberi]EFC40018.1 predicted protein [Naegleria gruberi]|eukprot:XP_002672762.1 predicted protein [Naegleria gruberi strain NEG-M]